MRRLTYLLVFLFSAPGLATVTSNGDGTSNLSINGPDHKILSACVGITGGSVKSVGGWLAGSLKCSGSIEKPNGTALTFVQIGVCTQAQADAEDPLPIVLCTQTHVDANRCQPEWIGVVSIPKPASCGKLFDFWMKRTGADFAKNGEAALELSRVPAPAAPGGDFGDP